MTTVERHYTHGRLIRAITDGLAALGKTPETVAVDDLSPVDEFHIGGRTATGYRSTRGHGSNSTTTNQTRNSKEQPSCDIGTEPPCWRHVA